MSLMNLKCPYCGDRAVTVGDKLILGPLQQQRCQNCDKLIGTSRIASFISAAIAASVVPLSRTYFEAQSLWIVITIMIALPFMWLYLTPLVKRDGSYFNRDKDGS